MGSAGPGPEGGKVMRSGGGGVRKALRQAARRSFWSGRTTRMTECRAQEFGRAQLKPGNQNTTRKESSSVSVSTSKPNARQVASGGGSLPPAQAVGGKKERQERRP